MVHPDWLTKLDELALESYVPLKSPPSGRSTALAGSLRLAWATQDVKGLTDADLAALAQDLSEDTLDFWEGERQRDLARVPREPQKAHDPPKRRNRTYKVRNMQQLAKRYCVELSKAGVSGKAPRSFMLDFLRKQGACTSTPFRQALRRAVVALPKARDHAEGLAKRCRCRGAQGHRLVKGPALREELFKWFCEVRRLCKGRLPLKVLEMKAKSLRQRFFVTALAARHRLKLPQINSVWLWRFRREYGISLRQPNRRWKVLRRVLLDRLRVMWSNTIRLRTVALVLLGYDLSADGFDQKPFHMDEAVSKGQKTLALKGAPEIALKELANATRERWTANTWVTSREDTALAGPPLEVLFEGGEKILRGLQMAVEDYGLGGVSMQVSNSESHRNEHVLTYLERALPATAHRACGRGQWRLLYCDRYRAHEGSAIQRLAWEHQAIVVLHGGGTTGVTQVNDTHLHAPLSKAYQDLEMHSGFVHLLMELQGCPRRDRAACLRDLALVWGHKELHSKALSGWKANVLVNALDGSEVVYAQMEEFELTKHLDFYEEGQVDEGEEVDGGSGRAWRDDDGPSPVSSDDGLVALTALAGAPQLTDAQQSEADRHAARLKALNDAEALAPPDARLEKAFGAVRRTICKEGCGALQGDVGVARAVRAQADLRRDAAAQLQDELKRRRVEREGREKAMEECQKRIDESLARLRREELALAAAGKRAAEAEAAAERRRAISRVAHGYSVNELGQGQPRGGSERHRKARIDLVTQIMQLGRELPVPAAATWSEWVRRWDEQGALQHGPAWAHKVRNDMLEVWSRSPQGKTTALFSATTGIGRGDGASTCTTS